MSHFSVIVATRDYPTDEVLGRELQPFHEFECTGVDDRYVRDIDQTAEVRAEYEKDTATRLRAADGSLHEPWDDQFYRDPTPEEKVTIGPIAGTGCGNGISWSSRDWGDGLGYRTKVRFVPDGMVEVEVPRKEFETFREYVEGYHYKKAVPFGEQPDTADSDKHKYGYCLLDEMGEVAKVVDRTNPDKQWDFWRVGGRYCRKFVPKPGCGGRSEPLSWEWESHRSGGHQPPVGVDIIRVGDMDKAAMKAQRVAERQKFLDETLSACSLPASAADDLFAQKRTAHARWMELDEPRPRGREYGEWCAANGFPLAAVLQEKCWDSPDVPEGMTAAGWVAAAPYLTGFAFLREGRWAERGKMGWWGAVHDEKDGKGWEAEFQSLVDAVPDDWYLTVVDCHT